MGDHDKTTLSSHAKKGIGAVMTIAAGAVLVAVLMNLQVTHTHEDSSKKQVTTLVDQQKELTQEVAEFKDRVASESGKVQGLEAEVRALTQNVKGLELEFREFRKEVRTMFATLTQNLIEVIKAQ